MLCYSLSQHLCLLKLVFKSIAKFIQLWVLFLWISRKNMSSSELLFFWFLLVGLLKLLFDRMDMTTFEHQQLRYGRGFLLHGLHVYQKFHHYPHPVVSWRTGVLFVDPALHPVRWFLWLVNSRLFRSVAHVIAVQVSTSPPLLAMT